MSIIVIHFLFSKFSS